MISVRTDPRRGDVFVCNATYDRLLTIEEAAELLNTKPRFTRRLIAERRIRFTRVGRFVRIPESAVHEFVAAGVVEPVHIRWRAGQVVA
jgi:excisionase family DNA binding protein